MARLLKAPDQRVGSAMFSQTTSTPWPSVSFITSSARFCLAIIDAEIRAITLCRVNSFIGARAGDDLGPEHLGDLNAGTAQGAGCAHDQNPFSGLEVGFTGQKIERHGKVARDDSPLREGDFVGKLHCVARRQDNKLRVTAPALNSNTFAVNAIGLFAFETGSALLTRGG